MISERPERSRDVLGSRQVPPARRAEFWVRSGTVCLGAWLPGGSAGSAVGDPGRGAGPCSPHPHHGAGGGAALLRERPQGERSGPLLGWGRLCPRAQLRPHPAGAAVLPRPPWSSGATRRGSESPGLTPDTPRPANRRRNGFSSSSGSALPTFPPNPRITERPCGRGASSSRGSGATGAEGGSHRIDGPRSFLG